MTINSKLVFNIIGLINPIGDFGFAIKLNHKDETIQSEIVGTPLYMSPQCMQKQKYTSKADIW